MPNPIHRQLEIIMIRKVRAVSVVWIESAGVEFECGQCIVDKRSKDVEVTE